MIPAGTRTVRQWEAALNLPPGSVCHGALVSPLGAGGQWFEFQARDTALQWMTEDEREMFGGYT